MYGLGNCVEGPLLERLDLSAVQGIRCTALVECIDKHRQRNVHSGIHIRYFT
jgi:hypothetical protein